MDKSVIKSAFFGYSKTSVCEYIAAVNEEFSRQLMSLEEEHKREKEELSSKLDAAQKELEEYKKVYGDIAAALLEAQQYSTALKENAEKENERIIAENAKLHEAQTARLSLYTMAINHLREQLASFISDTDQKLEAFAKETFDIEKEFEETTV